MWPQYKVEGTGDWWCFREHDHYTSNGYGFYRGPRRFETFGAWMMDLVVHWGWLQRLVKIGFLDAADDCTPVFWRWDFWNSIYNAKLRALEYEQWLKKRAASVVQWGA